MTLFVGTMCLMIFVKWSTDWESDGVEKWNIPPITPTIMKFFFGGDKNKLKPGEENVNILP